eukprot:6208963-Pleurochrysis_carterae.AAC.1
MAACLITLISYTCCNLLFGAGNTRRICNNSSSASATKLRVSLPPGLSPESRGKHLSSPQRLTEGTASVPQSGVWSRAPSCGAGAPP